MKQLRHQLLAPANAITIVGFLLTVFGASMLDRTTGVVLVVIGRLFDMLDGFVARTTRTSSKFGAALDAVADKVSGFILLLAAWRFDLAPRLVLAGMFLQNLINVFLSLAAVKTGSQQPLVTSRAGKRAMFLQITALVGYAGANGILSDYSLSSSILRSGAHLLALLGVCVFGLKASIGYAQDLKARQSK